jgi:7,8-dihydropterin-6-yl-methyl-4-(beta-D-ribofuranosyl)aminobenzene 5'-phosphate synthase
MCSEPTSHAQVTAAMPRPADGAAIDPVALQEVDEVVITTLVDNVYDALLSDAACVTRAPFKVGLATAPQFEAGLTTIGLRAEHGFSALVTVRRGAVTTTLLFDTGLSPDAMLVNADRLGLNLGDIQAVVLSHGHFDHAGGLSGLAGRQGVRSLPMVVHPGVWTRRRVVVPGSASEELPTLSRRSLESDGLAVVERRHPSLLVDECVLITGEIDRTTEFELGMPPPHQAWNGAAWEHDARVEDDQALVVNVRGRGLVVLTGCGHAGVVNIIRHAQRLTGVPGLLGLVGGLHLGGPAFEPSIAPTIEALVRFHPDLIVPGHCTGWRAQRAIGQALPAAWVAGSSGSSYTLSAA